MIFNQIHSPERDPMNTTEERATAMAAASAPHVLEVSQSMRLELAALLQQRAEIMRRVGTIRQTLAGLAKLFGDSNLDDVLSAARRGRGHRPAGVTRACRLILMESRTPLGVRQGCDELRRRFPELAQRHKDLSASVSTIFHRLEGYAEARCFPDSQGTRVWEWITEREPVSQSIEIDREGKEERVGQ
jgi:hypothetical protein